MTSRPSTDYRARHLSSFDTNADLAPRPDRGTPFAPPWVRINFQRPAGWRVACGTLPASTPPALGAESDTTRAKNAAAGSALRPFVPSRHN